MVNAILFAIQPQKQIERGRLAGARRDAKVKETQWILKKPMFCDVWLALIVDKHNGFDWFRAWTVPEPFQTLMVLTNSMKHIPQNTRFYRLYCVFATFAPPRDPQGQPPLAP